MNDEPAPDEPADLLDELHRAKLDAIGRCHDRTAARLATEIRRTARAARRLSPYVWALHTLMNGARDRLDPESGREAAIELIAILESEDLARQIQPDIDAAEYEWLVSRVSSCAYDGLGHATAFARGYNSEGVHDTIAEGIQVCRRTGKLECIPCFRGYATDVFRASDDLEMALHHARQVAAIGNTREGFDRRWAGASDETEILIIAGRLDAAEAASRRMADLVETYHDPVGARLRTDQLRATIRLLAGGDDPPPAGEGAAGPPADEYPRHHLREDLVGALRSCLSGDHAAAIGSLTAWDRRLGDRQCLDDWFEVRLRLIAAYRLSGDGRRAEALARPLESRAREARDWLTLRRLARLLDPGTPASPIAPAGPILVGSAAPPAPSPVPAGPTAAEAPPAGREPSPLGEALDAIAAPLAAGPVDPGTRDAALDALLGLDPGGLTDPSDAARMLHLATFLAGDPARSGEVWGWAEAVAAPFPGAAPVLNLLATLGDMLRAAGGSAVADRIDPDRIERLFRQSLDLDPDDLGNHGRAAVHHHRAGRRNEAERCLARSLRLDRSNARASLWLAEIYGNSDRSSDALAVLDLALRAGSDVPEVAWRAAVLAHSLGRNEALLTYLDRFEALAPGRPWVGYYRASGLLRLDRAVEALAALDEEERRGEGGSIQVRILRACAAAALGRPGDLRAHLAGVLGVRLARVEGLTHPGLASLFGRLWEAARGLPGDDPLVEMLSGRLLATGLAPDGLFEGPRRARPKVDGLGFFQVTVAQPLDDRWRDSEGCLAGEGDWAGYRIPWGILAPDEDEAGRIALSWQARCFPSGATVEEVQTHPGRYADHPGVVWQGLRSPSPAAP